MPSGNWSFPCSPRNPAKVREELRLLRTLIPVWRERGLVWGPRSGTQLEFGRRLRLSAASGADDGTRARRPSSVAVLPGDEDPDALQFQRQTNALTDDNLRWTARARWGTYRFFGFVTLDTDGCAALTPAGERFVDSPRPGEVLLRQLLKWQYPDFQHRGSRWPASEFAIHPFVAVARLIHELGGLSRREIALFCFTMRRTEDAAATAEAIRLFRARETNAYGRVGKRRAAHVTLAAAQARYEAEGRRVVLGSMDDYADALIRYLRYTGLFSVRGPRIVVAAGRESELCELIFDASPGGSGRPNQNPKSKIQNSLQLVLGEAPPVALAAPRPLFERYDDSDAFYPYYGSADHPRLPWEEPERLATLARTLDTQVADLRAREAHLRSGRTVLTGAQLAGPLPSEYDALVDLVDGLRRQKRRLEEVIYAAESHSPDRLAEALDFYSPILDREVLDPPTFLEWNTWRVFLALDQAREVVPHLVLDDDLQPLAPAQGNQADLEVAYGDFTVLAEVTLHSGAQQRQAEARPVTRHILDVMRKRGALDDGRKTTDRSGTAGADSSSVLRRPSVYGLFIAPKIHPDTATDFFVALKYRVIERQQIVAIPLTIAQFIATLRPFAASVAFTPEHLRMLLDACVQEALQSETGDEWLLGIDSALRRWLASLGAPCQLSVAAPRAIPLPLFT